MRRKRRLEARVATAREERNDSEGRTERTTNNLKRKLYDNRTDKGIN